MPLLTVVVPVHRVEGYLRQCLDSILDQSFTDLELIAVDDASPDRCPGILDEYAERDARVRVIHLEQNAGLGPARNVGLAQANGEYVWFVDSDDWLAPGSLSAVARAISATRPDVLVVDHTRVSWLGKHTRSDGQRMLNRSSGVLTLADEPGLLRLFTVAWNKVVRRDFLERAQLPFRPGWYEDLPFTFPILVAADRIATLGRICYHYRKRRSGAITQSTSERHAEAFEQWDAVFERLDALGERAEPYRGEIFGRMIWHLLVVASADGRLPRGERRAFFRRLSRQYHRYLPAASPTPARRFDRLRHDLVAHDRYKAYRGLRRLRLGARQGRRYADAVRRHVHGALTKAWTVVGVGYYYLLRMLPVDRRLAVFAAYWYRGFACNPAALHRKTGELRPDVRRVWLVDPKHQASVPPDVPHIVTGTLPYYRALARARWLVNNVNFPDFVVKRRGSVDVQTHHGTPVKTMGADQAPYPAGAKGTDFAALMRRCDRWDYSVSSNAHTTETWARAYPCRYETLEYGYPRNDRLANADAAEVAIARGNLEIDPTLVTVLYAPTHRELVSAVPSTLDPDELADALGPRYQVLHRAHYFYGAPGGTSHSSARDVSAHPSVEDVLLAADILVTDYSSVMFDYAVLDRPIALHVPDWDAYRRSRGVTFDLLAEPPGVVTTTLTDLVDAFHTGAVWDEAAAKARAEFRARFCYLDDGAAAERVVRRVFGDGPGAAGED